MPREQQSSHPSGLTRTFPVSEDHPDLKARGAHLAPARAHAGLGVRGTLAGLSGGASTVVRAPPSHSEARGEKGLLHKGSWSQQIASTQGDTDVWLRMHL